MNLLAMIDSYINRLFTPTEARVHPGQVADEWLKSLGLFTASAAGIAVNEHTAMTYTAVFACVRILAESVASLPLIVYRRLANGGKERAVDHPLYGLLHDLPNNENTSMELREMLQGHLALWGNAFCEKEFNNAGQVIGLWPLRPDITRVRRVNRRLIYEVAMDNGQIRTLSAEQVVHIRALSHDGVVGYSPIAQAREAIGLGLATEKFGAAFFGNGARPGGVLEYPGVLKDTARKNLIDSWEQMHRGSDNAHRIAILEEGMKYSAIGVPPEDAQFLESRKFQVTEIARIFRIPPHMLADLDRATFSNIEHLSLDFVIHTLRPWLVRWEQAINRDLFTPAERQQYFVEHLVEGLLRGDIQSRYQAYATGRQNGWLSANDIRTLENMNPVDGGDVYLVPLNMIPTRQVSGGMSSEPAPEEEDVNRCNCGYEHRDLTELRTADRRIVTGRQRMIRAYERIFRDAIGRILRREIADVKRSLHSHLQKRDATQFIIWLEGFYRDHREFWKRQIMPILLTYADQIGVNVAEEIGGEPKTSQEIDQFIQRYAENLAVGETASSFGQLRALIEQAIEANEDPTAAVETRLDEWSEKRTDKLAGDESRAALYAFVTAFYIGSGIGRMMWLTAGNSCPYCLELDGRVISIDDIFVEKDIDFQPKGAKTPMRRGSDTRHPPLHSGCDCGLVAR